MGSIHLLFLCALCLIFSPCSRGTRSQRPNRRIDNPIDMIQAQNNFNIQQGSLKEKLYRAGGEWERLKSLKQETDLQWVQWRSDVTTHSLTQVQGKKLIGVWHLISVGSKCGYLKLNNHRLEAVTVKVTNQDQDIRINTLHKLDGLCWDIKQDYKKDATPGRFSRKNRGVKTDIVIAETDYTNYAILFLQQRRKITVKLYGRGIDVSEPVHLKFRQFVIDNNIPEVFIYIFPRYGHCDVADEFHQLDDDFGKS